MNISLYLQLKDIPTFVQINSKTKDACDGLKVNPIDTINKKYLYYGNEINDKEEKKAFKLNIIKQLKIVNKSFPQLQTLCLHKYTFQFILENINDFREYIPNTKLFRTEKPVWIENPKINLKDEDCIRIIDGLNRISIENETVHKFNQVILDKLNIHINESFFDDEYDFNIDQFQPVQIIEECEYFHTKYIRFTFENPEDKPVDYSKLILILERLKNYCDYFIIYCNLSSNNMFKQSFKELKKMLPSNTIMFFVSEYQNILSFPVDEQDRYIEEIDHINQQENKKQLFNQYFNRMAYPYVFFITNCENVKEEM